MGLKNRLVCKILIDPDGVAVKYKQFTKNRRVVGDSVSVVRTLSDQTLDEFMFTFLGVADPALVRRMSETVMTPISVAGSLHTIEQVDELIRECGVDRVVVKDWALADAVANKYGAQAVIWPLDIENRVPHDVQVPACAGELLITDVLRDGLGLGLNTSVCTGWNIPVTIAGGCGKLHHVRDAFDAGASAVAVSSMFAFTDKSPIKLRSWLVSEGANVRAA